MRLPDPLRRWGARSDVKTASITSAALALCVFVPGMWLYGHLAAEAMREVDRWFEFVLDAAVRVRAPSGDLLVARGDWPDPERVILSRSSRPDRRKHGAESVWVLRSRN